MAYVVNAPEVPARPLWYLPPRQRHRIQTPRLPWGRVPVMTPPGGMAPVQDYHPGYRGYGSPVEERSCAGPAVAGFVGGAFVGGIVGGLIGFGLGALFGSGAR